jgi:hypothetical protein
MVRLFLSEEDKKEIVKLMQPKNMYETSNITLGNKIVSAKNVNLGIDVYGKSDDSEKSYTIERPEVLKLLIGGRRHRARKTQRRKSNKKRHTRRYRRK